MSAPLAQAIAGKAAAAAEARWMAIGEALAVGPDGVTLLLGGTILTGIKAVGTVTPGGPCLVGIIRGVASVQYVILGPSAVAAITGSGLIEAEALLAASGAKALLAFSITGDLVYAETGGDPSSFHDDEGTHLIDRPGSSTVPAAMVADANGHWGIRWGAATPAMYSGGAELVSVGEPLLPAQMPQRFYAVLGMTAGLCEHVLYFTSAYSGPRLTFGLYMGVSQAWFRWIGEGGSGTDASILVTLPGGSALEGVHVYEMELAADGTLRAWIDGDEYIHDGGVTDTDYTPGPGPSPMGQASGFIGGEFVLAYDALNWGAATYLSLYEMRVTVAPTDRAAHHAALMTKYGIT